MYHFVDDKEILKRIQSDCSQTMRELEKRLRNVYGISSQFFLVGSGRRKLITQNASKPIDLDYNLNILKETADGQYLKESSIKSLNKILNDQGLGTVSDSTSVITTDIFWFKDNPDIKFSMDICIVRKTKYGWERLIHEKTGIVQQDRYFWNISPNSHETDEKAKDIKQAGKWPVLEKEYLRLKNLYLCWNDTNHPSFVCYIEAVNNVHNRLFLGSKHYGTSTLY